jgi:hypothetical protein
MKRSTDPNPLPADQYLIPMSGKTYQALGEPGLVSHHPHLKASEWIEHPSRQEWKGALPKKRIFWAWRAFRPEQVKSAVQRVSLIGWDPMQPKQLTAWIPANQDEAYAFVLNPETADLQRQVPIIVPGATVNIEGREHVLILHHSGPLRTLDVRPIDTCWTADARFLFVQAVRS